LDRKIVKYADVDDSSLIGSDGESYP